MRSRNGSKFAGAFWVGYAFHHDTFSCTRPWNWMGTVIKDDLTKMFYNIPLLQISLQHYDCNAGCGS